MKALSLSALLLFPGLLMAQTPQNPLEIRVIERGRSVPIWIVGANSKVVRYTETKGSTVTKDVRINQLKDPYFLRPKAFDEALALYRDGKYEEARKIFATIREKYAAFESLPGNYSTLAGFYQLECCRKLQDFEQLHTLLERYDPKALLRKDFRKQIDVLGYWDTLRTESWDRMIAIAQDAQKEEMPAWQRAQIAYLSGLAYEKQGKVLEALGDYNMAFNVDPGSTDVVTRLALRRAIELIAAQPDTKKALETWETDLYDENSAGAGYLVEVGSLVRIWNAFFGSQEKLPQALADFEKFAPELEEPM